MSRYPHTGSRPGARRGGLHHNTGMEPLTTDAPIRANGLVIDARRKLLRALEGRETATTRLSGALDEFETQLQRQIASEASWAMTRRILTITVRLRPNAPGAITAIRTVTGACPEPSVRAISERLAALTAMLPLRADPDAPLAALADHEVVIDVAKVLADDRSARRGTLGLVLGGDR